MDAGKPQKQSLAIAYAMKRRGKKMAYGGYAKGGEVELEKDKVDEDMLHHGAADMKGAPHEKDQYDPKEEPGVKHDEMAMEEDDRMLNQHGECEEGPYGEMMAEGGMLTDDGYQSEDHEDDMVGHIMKQRQCHYSKGGQVANKISPDAEFEDNDFDDLVLDDTQEGHYPGSQEIGDGREDDDRKDMVSMIMRSRKKRDRNPVPA